VAVAAVLNPPTSRQVFERLADFLTPPHGIALQAARAKRRSGAYDNLAAHCLTVAHKPHDSKRWAYRACTAVIKRHSKSFYLSARLLPAGKRDSIMALYAFCRLSDDIVDGVAADEDRGIAMVKARLALDSWSRANAGLLPGSDHPVVVAWADTRARLGIPQVLADDLVKGVRMDLTIDRYDTWDDLWLYCYRVASTVGLMSMYITGTETMDAVPYAVQLGVALQLTNILRDAGEDARAGRIYLPREDMERFGYTEEMLLSGTVNSNFVSLMQYEIEKARALYRAAEPGISMLPADSRLAVAAASTLYRGILGKIEEADYDVFTRRAHLSMGEKVRLLPGLWWKQKASLAGQIGRQAVTDSL
jgi:15-cis-phytoene synthase